MDLYRSQSFVNGKWVGANDAATFSVINPGNGQVLTHVANLGREETQDAITAASSAWGDWRRRTAKERGDILRRWYDLVVAHTDDLAKIMTLEQGKPLAQARGEIAYAASFVEWFAEQAKRVEGDILAATRTDTRILVMRQPVGVCAAITPWNFPSAMVTRKVAPALAAGCTIILKPAEQTPLSALALAELAARAGVPAGVLNVVTADEQRSVEVGRLLCESQDVRKLTFTGSTGVGRILMGQSAPTIKKLSLELGGHAPFIVFDDADVDAAVEGAMVAKFRNGGQSCIASNRFYVQEGIYAQFLEKFHRKVEALKTGDGLEANVDQGPLIDAAGLQKVREHVADAVSKGAKVLIGGKPLGGLFFEPTVLADVTESMVCMHEETFGPVAPVVRFRDEDDVIRLANATQYGLAAYFYSQNLRRVFKVAEVLEYGMVGVNSGFISNAVAPFGGVKQSGLGREGSIYGMDEFLEMKYVALSGL
ncbi:Succinate-semialdehyde dehydrogenase/glutarate-semialdehyde dehydrogenase OS=Castellaniella defragrans OX=75697 GN=HNR28_001799 PE=3 SV=1 [Castellaniella defragrans]